MRRYRIISLCLISAALITFSAFAVPNSFLEAISTPVSECITPLPEDISAETWAIWDSSEGKVIAGRDTEERRCIASLTKLATALTVLEECAGNAEKLDEPVPVSNIAASVEGSKMYLAPGTRVSVRTLLYGLMLASGNDAAIALAEYFGGMESFVEKMNSLASKLGMTGTHFDNPHGLDSPEHYSTAADMCLLTAAAMENETLREITSTREYRAEGYEVHNHNRLLWEYTDMEGVKTGYTSKAGRCLITSRNSGGRRLIIVTLNAPDDWNDHKRLYAVNLCT